MNFRVKNLRINRNKSEYKLMAYKITHTKEGSLVQLTLLTASNNAKRHLEKAFWKKIGQG